MFLVHRFWLNDDEISKPGPRGSIVWIYQLNNNNTHWWNTPERLYSRILIMSIDELACAYVYSEFDILDNAVSQSCFGVVSLLFSCVLKTMKISYRLSFLLFRVVLALQEACGGGFIPSSCTVTPPK